MTTLKKFFKKNLGGEKTNKSLGIAFMCIGGLFVLLHIYCVACYLISGGGLGYIGDDIFLFGSMILGVISLVGGNLLRKKPY